MIDLKLNPNVSITQDSTIRVDFFTLDKVTDGYEIKLKVISRNDATGSGIGSYYFREVSLPNLTIRVGESNISQTTRVISPNYMLNGIQVKDVVYTFFIPRNLKDGELGFKPFGNGTNGIARIMNEYYYPNQSPPWTDANSVQIQFTSPIIISDLIKGGFSNIKINNSWKEVEDSFIKINNTWVEIEQVYIKVSGQWKEAE